MTQETPSFLSSHRSINVNNLGYFLDGWADLVEGMGAKANEVRQGVFEQLQGRKMPAIGLNNRDAYVSALSGERRAYVITNTDPGATTTVYIGEHGKDLYAAWRTFIKPVWNINVLVVAGAAAVVLGAFTGGINSTSVGWGQTRTTFSLIGWIFATLGFAVLAALGLATAGRVLRGNTWAFFFIEPNVFDAEDITAMGLSAHKSILRALDNSGIDISKLRLKQTFKGGRRGEEV